ncbi:MAG TPA: trypsin-like peptidase domain-containing protein [Usitatibacter sp.]|nr:trypsin-like peptidase domain-containing protein [Usitatibacter sp.]
MAHPKKTLYEILGVPRDADALDIGLAHERRVAEMRRTVPPDPSQQALVQQAFEVLASEGRRAAYDQQLLTAAERSAAAEQATTDLEIGEEEPPKRKVPTLALAGIAAVVAIVGWFALRPAPPAPKPEPLAVASKPAAPPPPKLRTALEVLGSAASSTGRVMAYSMSGAATPIGLAVSIEAGNMVTTCHAISAGGSLVVKVGKDQFPADLTITDEALDLCRLSLPGYATPPLKVASEEPKAGDKVYTMALDAKGDLTAAEGTVKAMRGPLIELTTPVAAPSSGAGVFDQYGALLGIATAPHDQGANVHVAIPATAISQMRTRTK